jgi:hypothetical protein
MRPAATLLMAAALALFRSGAGCNDVTEVALACESAIWRARLRHAARCQCTPTKRRVGATPANARIPQNAVVCGLCSVRPEPSHLPSARLPTTSTASPGASQARNLASGMRTTPARMLRGDARGVSMKRVRKIIMLLLRPNPLVASSIPIPLNLRNGRSSQAYNTGLPARPSP